MKREYHYSVNPLSYEISKIWRSEHTLEEICANRHRLMEQALTQIPIEERPNWILVNRAGLLNNLLHEIYIAFKLFWLVTPKGRIRSSSIALKMVGVPFIKVKWVPNGLEIAGDGVEVVQIAGLK